jgi:Ni/Co efflux regulator RcnB
MKKLTLLVAVAMLLSTASFSQTQDKKVEPAKKEDAKPAEHKAEPKSDKKEDHKDHKDHKDGEHKDHKEDHKNENKPK